jgi:predicted TIM-barrel fold metal-dependent hydrolase
MHITDFHTHAFPDALADRAIPELLDSANEKGVTAYLDGHLSSLLASMDRAGIHRAVICSIATRPEQFEKILAWSKTIHSDRIEPFPSVHPRDPAAPARVAEIAARGFKGIKLHPYYQDFVLDDESLFPLYKAIAEHGLILVSHTGFDIAFPRERRADPVRIRNVIAQVPDLTFVATHFGSWDDWNEVEKYLLGRPVYMECSYSLPMLGEERARRMFRNHPPDHLLFGTDSPWQEQSAALADLRALNLGERLEHATLSENASRLLD